VESRIVSRSPQAALRGAGPRQAAHAVPRRHDQRGVILLIAMVAVVALAFAGMSLVRVVATTTAIGNNVHARQQAMYAATVAFEHDVVALVEDRVIDTTRDDPAHNYFASRQPAEDSRGVPRALLSAADYPAGASVIDAGDGFAVRHVVERLCALPGAASADTCTLSPPSVEATLGTPPPGEPPREPGYRVTMRVEGPGGTVAYAQAMLSTTRANPRLSWQMLDE
jgi:hypothetical protein